MSAFLLPLGAPGDFPPCSRQRPFAIAIDTKGVDDVAVREDLDARLKDPRTTIIFCSRFNDAPGTSTRLLLQHMRQTFSETLDSGKVSVLALPRAGEARAMKDEVLGGELELPDILQNPLES